MEGKVIRYFVWLCVWAGPAILLSGCHYSEEDKWKVCCALYVLRDETPSASARTTIIKWQRATWFDGDGSAGDWNDDNKSSDTIKKRQIKSEIANFLADSPGGRATDYFLSLGMTCSPDTAMPKVDVTHCDIELPISVVCGPTYRWLPGTTPIPEELQKPLPARLRMTVDISTSTLLDASTRIEPVSGGRLCHR
jgi:hypothetical protein